MMDFGDYVSMGGEGIYSGCGEVTPERDRLFLAGLAGAASLATSSGFGKARNLRLRVGFASGFGSASGGAGMAAAAGAEVSCAFGLRPRPSAFAKLERRSE